MILHFNLPACTMTKQHSVPCHVHAGENSSNLHTCHESTTKSQFSIINFYPSLPVPNLTGEIVGMSMAKGPQFSIEFKGSRGGVECAAHNHMV